MYILVRQKDNIIIGTAKKQVDEESASKNGCRVYEISDDEFKPSMLGSKLEAFDTESK